MNRIFVYFIKFQKKVSCKLIVLESDLEKSENKVGNSYKLVYEFILLFNKLKIQKLTIFIYFSLISKF